MDQLSPGSPAAYLVQTKLLSGQTLILEIAGYNAAYSSLEDTAFTNVLSTLVALCESPHTGESAFPYNAKTSIDAMSGAIIQTTFYARRQHILIDSIPDAAILRECSSKIRAPMI
jgi:hypothetical protein